MGELLIFLVIGLALASTVAGATYGTRFPFWSWPLIGAGVLMFKGTGWIVKNFFRGSATTVGAVGSLPAGGVLRLLGPPRVRKPESVELIPRKTAYPSRTPRSDPKPPSGNHQERPPSGLSNWHGYWPEQGKLREAAHFNLTGESRSGKGQTHINYIIKHQLQCSEEHLIINDVKPELEDVVRRYARPDDRIFVYTADAAKKKSSALNLFTNTDLAPEMARMLTQPEKAGSNQRWPKKAADAIARIAHEAYADQGSQGAISLGGIYDVAADREHLNYLRDASPYVDNVADNPSEWGSIRSNMIEALEPLAIPRVRRMLDPLPGTTQPYFGPGAPRTIVLLQPSQDLAKTLEPIIAAMLHVLYDLACAGGWAGGVGTKLIGDEAASFMALEELPSYLELGAGRRVQVMYVLQSRKQLVDVLTESRADRALDGTELKALGATSDRGAAEYLENLSTPTRVQYRGPRDPDGDRPWSEHFRRTFQAHEATDQDRGDWTVQHHSTIEKSRVPEEEWYYRQDHPPRQKLRVYGIPKR